MSDDLVPERGNPQPDVHDFEPVWRPGEPHEVGVARLDALRRELVDSRRIWQSPESSPALKRHLQQRISELRLEIDAGQHLLGIDDRDIVLAARASRVSLGKAPKQGPDGHRYPGENAQPVVPQQRGGEDTSNGDAQPDLSAFKLDELDDLLDARAEELKGVIGL